MTVPPGLALALHARRAVGRRLPGSPGLLPGTPYWDDLVGPYDAELVVPSPRVGGPHSDSDVDRTTWYDLSGLGSRNATVLNAHFLGDGPNSNSDATNRGFWFDRYNPRSMLVNFAYNNASGWAGSGTSGDPYRLQFDGVDDSVDLGATAAILWTRASTVQVVFVAKRPTSGVATVWSEARSDVERYVALQQLSDGRLRAVYYYDASNQGSVASTITVADGETVSAVIVTNGNQMTLYVNGSSQGSTTIPTTSWWANRATFGCRYDTALREFWGGAAVALRTWARAFTATDVAALEAFGYTSDLPSGHPLLSTWYVPARETLAAKAIRYTGWCTDPEGLPAFKTNGRSSVQLNLNAVRPSLESMATTWEMHIRLPFCIYPVDSGIIAGASGGTPSGHPTNPVWGPWLGWTSRNLRWYHRDAHNTNPTYTTVPLYSVANGLVVQVAGVLNGNSVRIYVDGVPVATATLAVPNPVEDWVYNSGAALCAYPGGTSQFVTAWLYGLRIYARPLSDAEVLALYEAGPFASDFPRAGLVYHLSAARAVPPSGWLQG